MRKDVTMEQVHEGLRAWAHGGHPANRAAVDILIEEEHWLRKMWPAGMISYDDDPDIVGDGPPIAVIDWVRTARNRWPQSGGERAFLLAVCSIGSSAVQQSFHELFTSMDRHYTMLVLKALQSVKRL